MLRLAILLSLACATAVAGPLPTTDSVTFVRLDEPAGYIQVIVRGRGMTGEWEVHGATVGKTSLLGVVAFPNGEGLVGMLPPEPPDGGEVLVIGTRASVSTGKRFALDAVKGAHRAPLETREDCSLPVTPGKSIGPIKLGMTTAELTKQKATLDPANSHWYRLGPITAKIDASSKVDMTWIDRPTMCLVDGAKRVKLELPRPAKSPPPFPFPDCPWPTDTMIGGACFTCADRGLEVCHGADGWYPSVKVLLPKKP